MTVTGSSGLTVYVNTLQQGSSSVSFGEDKQSDDAVYDVTTCVRIKCILGDPQLSVNLLSYHMTRVVFVVTSAVWKKIQSLPINDFHPPTVKIIFNDRVAGEKYPQSCQWISKADCCRLKNSCQKYSQGNGKHSSPHTSGTDVYRCVTTGYLGLL